MNIDPKDLSRLLKMLFERQALKQGSLGIETTHDMIEAPSGAIQGWVKIIAPVQFAPWEFQLCSPMSFCEKATQHLHDSIIDEVLTAYGIDRVQARIDNRACFANRYIKDPDPIAGIREPEEMEA